ncbi:poly(A) polymerase, putative [Talaromyces stipitatus ATCC 10500]|uniref:Poly(A) polymerase, putative n=1 Tax=Talaromyces stipitatus (strain ATCC 10500 / CBS 375.48 / QM 6759 / NRRL 1006) TaxID=441959 RepID=B8M8E9_TALSN|nr:poly(A) polymerase, putative [Talaromyces stipitatus ATCC 10500]EED20462.1 poly(A) polymerase, putative [Talaromyces stipitatus ATCC 10500]
MDSMKDIDRSEPPNKKVKIVDTDTDQGESKMTTPVPIQIELSPAEHLLRTLLLDCRDHVSTGSGNRNAGDMWFVGGWVRDKLLGKQSCDIDVAMSNMTGPEFSSLLKEFLSLESDKSRTTTKGDIYKEQATKRGLPAEIRGFYEIDRNPKKGKHLQTTSAKIFGLDIDFVNLRTENDLTDQEGSVSRAEQDAKRRDATVNSIFYNLDSQEIEDYTANGLSDLKAKVLRTPLDARKTFTDDPLRILRFVRLASTLGFTIDEGTETTIRDSEIQCLISTRTSPERIGLELKKMITGPDPVTALMWIHRLGLYKQVFLCGQSQKVLDKVAESEESEAKGWESEKGEYVWPSAWPEACKTVSKLFLPESKDSLLATELAQSQDIELVWQMAVWCPLALLCQPDDTRPFPVVKPATKAIHATNEKSRLLEDSLSNMREIRAMIDNVVGGSDKGSLRRGIVGKAIRSWGKTWRLQALFTLLTDILSVKLATKTEDLLNRYSVLLKYVSDQKLQDAPSMKQLLTGGEIKEIFELRRSGPFMNGVLKAVLEWQFDHENEYEDNAQLKEKAIEWLRGEKEELNIPDPDVA